MEPNREKEFNRKLKVYSRYKSRNGATIIIPEIRLSGKWLMRCGFKDGMRISVSCSEGKIAIVICNEGTQ